MPTFKNETTKPIFYKVKDKEQIIIFDPQKEVMLEFWVPYLQLGLTLMSAEYPPVPNMILLSGEFTFMHGLERKFNIDACDSYTFEITVNSGKVRLYLGATKNSMDISSSYNYKVVLDWSLVPYIRIVGLQDDSNVMIHAEVKEK